MIKLPVYFAGVYSTQAAAEERATSERSDVQGGRAGRFKAKLNSGSISTTPLYANNDTFGEDLDYLMTAPSSQAIKDELVLRYKKQHGIK